MDADQASRSNERAIWRGYDRRYDHAGAYTRERALVEAHEAWLLSMEHSPDHEARALVQPIDAKCAPTNKAPAHSPPPGGLNGRRLDAPTLAGTPLHETASPSPESPTVPRRAFAQGR